MHFSKRIALRGIFLGTIYRFTLNISLPSSGCACEKEIRSANFARRHPSSILEPPRLSDDC